MQAPFPTAALLVTPLVAAAFFARPALAEPAPAPPPLAPFAATARTPAPPPPVDEWRQLRFTAGVSLTGIGALSLVLGSVLGVRAVISKKDIGTHCNAAGQCDLIGYSLGAEATDFGLISTIVLAAGLGVSAAGVGLLISATPKKPSATAWIRPTPGGVTLGARW